MTGHLGFLGGILPWLIFIIFLCWCLHIFFFVVITGVDTVLCVCLVWVIFFSSVTVRIFCLYFHWMLAECYPFLLTVWWVYSRGNACFLKYIPMTYLISSISVVLSPFSFLFLLIWILSLFPLVSLVNGVSMLLIL